MNQHLPFRVNAFNAVHTPSDTERVSSSDGIKTELSKIFRPAFPFDSLVLSANFQTVTDGCLLLEAQVYRGGEWSGFYKLGLLSGKFKRSFPEQADGFGRVETDELRLSAPAEAYRYRLKFYGDAELTGLWACGVRAPFAYDAKTAARLPAGLFAVAVPPVSQMELEHADRRRICSPSSVCMALNALGFSAPLEPLLLEVFDQTAAIYGNWVFNVAAAGAYGARAYVRRFSALEELKEFLSSDCLVVASIGYVRGGLDNAPLEHTAGHLVLIRGWENGKILTADPAAPSKDCVLRAYDARQFAAAWLQNRQGAAYIVRKK